MKRSHVIAAVVVAYAGTASWGIQRPFLRHRDGVLTYYGNLARNWVWHSPANVGYRLLETASPDLDVYENWRDYTYTHRPVLSVAGLAAAQAIFGMEEWVIRLNLILVGVASVWIFAGIAARTLAPPWDLVATGVCAFLPMFHYFSHVAVHLVYATCFALAAWYGCLRWDDGRRYRVLTLAALALACLSDWPGYYAALALAGASLCARRPRRALASIAIAALCGTAHLMHLWLLRPDGSLVREFLQSGADRSVVAGVSAARFVWSEAREAGLYFTAGALMLAIVGATCSIRARRASWMWLAFLGLDEILFARLAVDHDYMTYPLVPVAAVAAASGGAWLWRSRAGKVATVVLLAVAGVQAGYVIHDRQTREGAYEVQWRLAREIREGTRPRDRILLVVPDIKQYTPFYAERYVASTEPGLGYLCVHPTGWREPLDGSAESWCDYLARRGRQYDVVVVGLRDAARREIRYLRGASDEMLERFGFYPTDHPVHQAAASIAVRAEDRGPVRFYWTR